MEKALIGLSNNIFNNIDKIKVWSKSFKKHSEGRVILLCTNSTNEELNLCNDLGIETVPVTIEDTWYINHKRLLHTYDFIEKSNVDLFLVTDVFDVVFQGDPFKKWDLNYDIFIGSEGILVRDEPWNSDNINKIFPSEFEKCKNNEVICSGVIGGKKESLVKLYKRMYELCEGGSNEHNIKDQAALIVMIANNEIDNLKIFNLDDSWVVHCAVSGPTPFFESWGFKNNLRYGIPYSDDNKILTKNGDTFDIVHQFNRIPQWNNFLINEYV